MCTCVPRCFPEGVFPVCTEPWALSQPEIKCPSPFPSLHPPGPVLPDGQASVHPGRSSRLRSGGPWDSLTSWLCSCLGRRRVQVQSGGSPAPHSPPLAGSRLLCAPESTPILCSSPTFSATSQCVAHCGLAGGCWVVVVSGDRPVTSNMMLTLASCCPEEVVRGWFWSSKSSSGSLQTGKLQKMRLLCSQTSTWEAGRWGEAWWEDRPGVQWEVPEGRHSCQLVLPQGRQEVAVQTHVRRCWTGARGLQAWRRDVLQGCVHGSQARPVLARTDPCPGNCWFRP